MDELYMWGSALVVGLASLKLIPAKKLTAANKRMRSRFSGKVIAILYIVFWILLFAGAYFICTGVNLNPIAKNVILGVIIGLFVGFIPAVDKRNCGEEEQKEASKREDE